MPPQNNDPGISFEDTSRIFKKQVLNPSDFSGVVLVYGHAGDGKTHYIRQQLSRSPFKLIIAVNEAFTPLKAINSLNTLSQDSPECALFFNFTINPHFEEGGEEKRKIEELLDTIGWFFYHLLILGYVEDPSTGASYRLPGGQDWAVYIEVPSLGSSHRPEESLRLFNTEISTLGLLGSRHIINVNTPYTVDRDVQLVCKYLRAYEIGGVKGINRLYRES